MSILLDAKPQSSFIHRSGLHTVDRGNRSRRAHHLAVIASDAAIRQVDTIFEADTHEVTTQRQAEGDNLEHIASGRGDAPDRLGKQSQALVDGAAELD